MNLVDVLIVIACLVSLASGYRRGFWLALTQYAGMLVGVVVGVYFAPTVIGWVGVADSLARQVVALVVIVAAASIGGSIGFGLGGPLRRWLLARRVLGTLDSLAGAAFSVVVTLAIVWLLALALARGPSPDLAQAIQRSRIVERLDRVAPEPPAFVAQIQQILSGTALPPLFTGLEPILRPPRPLAPESAATAGVQAAAAATVKVQGVGCGGVATGSGFVVDTDTVVTNAHVVSGTNRTTVSTREGRSRPATVIVFDPDKDLAVLRAPGLNLPALARGDGETGTRGAVIGFPGGGPQTIGPAVLQQRINARGRDIYSEDIVRREVWTVSARVRPGNSGGPLVDEQGRWIGVIFAASVTTQDQAFALTAAEAAVAIREANAASEPINVRRLPCSR